MSERKHKVGYIFCVIVGCIGMWLFISHAAHFSFPHNYALRFETYCGTNIVSGWADFSYFTYHSLIFFCLWSILFGMSSLFGWGRLKAFLCKSTVVSFLFCNYCLTVVLYTVFELTAQPITFGMWDDSLLAIHSLGTNLIAHYLYFAFALTAFLCVKTNGGNIKIALLFISLYFVVYCVVVKLCGEFAYSIRWFPYVIFDAESFSQLLGVGRSWAIVLLVVVFALLATVYFVAFVLCVRFKNKKTAVIEQLKQ